MADNCVDKLKEIYPDLSKVELNNLDTAFRTLDEELVNSQDVLNNMRKEMYDQVSYAAVERQQAEVTHLKNLKKNLDHAMSKEFRGLPLMGIESLVMYTPFNTKNQSRNAADLATVFQGRHEKKLRQALEQIGSLELMTDRGFGVDVFTEFYNRVHGRKGNFDKMVTGTVDAIIKVNKSMIEGMRAVGSTIRYNETHLIAQNYDPVKITASPESKNQWVNDMLSRIDINKSFGPNIRTEDRARKELEKMADRMSKIDMEKTDARFSVMGGKRSIVYKEGLGAFEMNEKYGYSDLVHGLNSGISRLSKKYGLTSVFGNDPDRGIKDLKEYVDKVSSKFGGREGDFTMFNSGVDLLRNTGPKEYANPDGIFAKAEPFQRAARNYASATMLGASAPKVFMDAPLTVITSTAHGQSIPRATMNYMVDLIDSVAIGKEGRRAIAEEVWQVMDDFKMRMYAEMGSLQESDWQYRFMEKFYSYSGLSYIGELTKTVAMRSHIRGLKEIMKEGTVNELQLNVLRRAGISGAEATKLRGIYNKSNSVTPTAIVNSGVGGADELADKVAAYLLQATNESITTTDTRIQAALEKDKAPDTVKRLGLSIAVQFMTSAIKETSNLNKAARTISPEGRVRSKKGMAVIASGAITLALADYVTDQTKQIASGKWEDKDPTAEEFRKHMIDSGGWGLLISSIIKATKGKNPVGDAPSLRVAGRISDHIKNEWAFATDKKKSKDSFLHRNLEFMFEMSPLEKFWATGLLRAAYSHIIEDTSKRSSARRRRRK